MADREGPDFDWLYNGKGTPPPPVPRQQRSSKNPQTGQPEAGGTPRPPAPEETRMLPVQPQRPDSRSQTPDSVPDDKVRPATLAGGGGSKQPPTGTEYGGRGDRGGRGRRGGPGRPKARTIRRVILAAFLAWLVFLVWVPVSAWQDVPRVEYAPTGERPAEQPGTTYLLVGSDSRAGLTKEEQEKIAGGGDDVGKRTDTIMILHVGSGKNLLMSIPRDSIVPIPGRSTTKINAAFAWGGPQLLVETVEQNTGVRIDSYVETGMGGIVSIVDAVGGIEICPEFDMKDPAAGINIKEGCQEADGATALGYARSRKTDPRYGDITRAKHQREVVNAVGKEALTPSTVLNPVKYWKLAHSVPDAFSFGEGTSIIQAARWARAMTQTSGDAGMTCGVPIANLSVKWDTERALKVFDYIKRDAIDEMPAELCTPTGLPKSVTG